MLVNTPWGPINVSDSEWVWAMSAHVLGISAQDETVSTLRAKIQAAAPTLYGAGEKLAEAMIARENEKRDRNETEADLMCVFLGELTKVKASTSS